MILTWAVSLSVSLAGSYSMCSCSRTADRTLAPIIHGSGVSTALSAAWVSGGSQQLAAGWRVPLLRIRGYS